MRAEQSPAESWQSSPIQVGCDRMPALLGLSWRCSWPETDVSSLVIEAFQPTRQLVSSPVDVSSMRTLRTNAIRFILASLAGLCGIASSGAARAADDAHPPLAIQFSLDRPIDAAAAPFVMAASGGLFSAENLAVTIN